MKHGAVMRPAGKSPANNDGAKRVSALIDAGVWLQLANDVTGAREVFRKALELDPENARAKQLYQSTETPSSGPALDATIRLPPAETLAAQLAQAKPTPAGAPNKLDKLLRQAKDLRDSGNLDRAAGVVLRALVVDGESLDAHELAYELLTALGRSDAAAVELVHIVRVCVQRGEVERARRYLPALVRLRGTDPNAAGLTTQLLGDALSTLPPDAD